MMKEWKGIDFENIIEMIKESRKIQIAIVISIITFIITIFIMIKTRKQPNQQNHLQNRNTQQQEYTNDFDKPVDFDALAQKFSKLSL